LHDDDYYYFSFFLFSFNHGKPVIIIIFLLAHIFYLLTYLFTYWFAVIFRPEKGPCTAGTNCTVGRQLGPIALLRNQFSDAEGLLIISIILVAFNRVYAEPKGSMSATDECHWWPVKYRKGNE